MDTKTVLIAFALTLFAGLSTGIGSALAFFAKRTNTKLLSASLGFSAGVMIYISFVDLLPEAKRCLINCSGQVKGSWTAALAFFAGILLVSIIDKVVPAFENPHEIHRTEEMDAAEPAAQFRKLYRMGIFTAIAIAIHNFPEGIATFISALKDIKLGIAIAIAIAIHNIPEGIAVSVPIFYATGSRRKAFVYSFLSGLAEPIGALVGYVILFSFFGDLMFGLVFATVAGMMVFISLDELLPAAQEYGEHHLAAYGLVAGMAVMAVSLILFA